jgi:glycopeptide antibiotics resistance protein
MRVIPPRPARLLLVAYLGFVGLVTLFPTGLGQLEPNLVPLAGIAGAFEDGGMAFGVWQLIGNLLLLAPMGVLLPAAVPGARTSVVIGLALVLACGIELVQWWLPTGRMADIDDVWLNTLGSVVGLGLARSLGDLWPLR